MILSVFLISICGFISCRKNDVMVGGQCVYKSDPVTITVKSIENKPRTGNQSSPAAEEMLIVGYEITFDNGIKSGSEIVIKSGEAKARDVKVGKQFHASINRLVSGTCNPEPVYPDFQEWK